MRSPIQYFGGKGQLKTKILPILESIPHQVYIEPFFGGGSIFFSKRPSPVEVINDLSRDLIGLMRLLQEDNEDLKHRLRYTLYSLEEYKRAFDIIKSDETDPILRAWAFFVTQNQGFSGRGAAASKSWSKAFISKAGMAFNCNKWAMRLSMLEDWHRRLLHAQIDCRDALDVIRYWDTPDTLFYLDPPYIAETRRDGGEYTHECDDDFHASLSDLLGSIQGKYILSGYNHSIYDRLPNRIDIETTCSATGRTRKSGMLGKGSILEKQKRTESLWMNDQCMLSL